MSLLPLWARWNRRERTAAAREIRKTGCLRGLCWQFGGGLIHGEGLPGRLSSGYWGGLIDRNLSVRHYQEFRSVRSTAPRRSLMTVLPGIEVTMIGVCKKGSEAVSLAARESQHVWQSGSLVKDGCVRKMRKKQPGRHFAVPELRRAICTAETWPAIVQFHNGK